ncbi:hypothetical protein [Spirosoma koreense]
MDTNELLQDILLGGILGLLGQGIRVLAGLKKLSESKKVAGEDSFDTRRLIVSLLLGFIAGGIGVLTLLSDDGSLKLTRDALLTLIGIGYAGVDFLESFLTKYIPKPAQQDLSETAPTEEDIANGMARPKTLVQVAKLPYSSN